MGNNNYVPQENYYKYHPKTSQNTPSKTRILINSLHPSPPNTSSSSSLSLTNSLILSLELKNSRSSKKNERRRKPMFFLSLSTYVFPLSLVLPFLQLSSTRKEVPCCFLLLNSYKGKINSFIHSVFLFRFFIIFVGKEYVENHIPNCFPYLNS